MNDLTAEVNHFYHHEFMIHDICKSLTKVRISDLPDNGPVITGTLPRYKVGDQISANCTSANSIPAARLNWYINGEEATPAMLVNYPLQEDFLNRKTSTLGLRLVSKYNNFSSF